MKKLFSNIMMDFFNVYLSKEAGFSENTLKSYRDTIVLYINFLEDTGVCKPANLNVSFFTSDNVRKFLDWLETFKGSCANTRNQRLAALKAFCNYVIRKMPECYGDCQDILSLRLRRVPTAAIEYLPIDSIAAVLSQPDHNTIKGIRDLAIIAFMYETGCRVQELIDARFGDVTFKKPSTVTLKGKGKKTRVIPISSNAASIMSQYSRHCGILRPEQPLFSNRFGKPLSRSGVAYILNKYFQLARQANPDIFIKSIHPHVLRHSKAMHLLENGVNLIYIRDFLGHTSVTTTEIYAKCNPELKRKYILEAAVNLDESILPYSNTEKDILLDWLKNNI